VVKKANHAFELTPQQVPRTIQRWPWRGLTRHGDGNIDLIMEMSPNIPAQNKRSDLSIDVGQR